MQHRAGEGGTARLDPALDADPFPRPAADDLREVRDEARIRHCGAHGPVGRVAVGHPRLLHDETEEVLHRVLVRLHRLPVLQLIEEDVVRLKLDRCRTDACVLADLVGDIVERKVPRTAQSDLAEFASAAATSHDLDHGVDRRLQDPRHLVDARRVSVRVSGDGIRRAGGNPLEQTVDKVLGLSVNDVVDAEGLLHSRPDVELPHTGAADDDPISSSRSRGAPDRIEEHGLRVRSVEPAVREGHRDGP